MNYKFKSKADAMGRAKKKHACLDCRYHQPEIYKTCPQCGSKNRQYFMSDIEFKRGMLLLTMRDAGSITDLKFQPRFQLEVNGKKIGTYVADCAYWQGPIMVVEDSKPPNFIDAFAAHKMRHFEAQTGITIKIPQRKSQNMSEAKPGQTLI